MEHLNRLTLSMHPLGSDDWLPLLNEKGQLTGDREILALIQVWTE